MTVPDDIKWHIGFDEKHGTLDTSLPKAYFYWHRDGTVVRSAAYTEAELREEIRHMQEQSIDCREFEKALEQL